MDDPAPDYELSEQADYLRGWQAGRRCGLIESQIAGLIVGSVCGALAVALILGAVFWGGVR